MYCDCILARAGWQTGYIAVYVISAIFVVAALAVMVGGWRRNEMQDLEAVKQTVLEAED